MWSLKRFCILLLAAAIFKPKSNASTLLLSPSNAQPRRSTTMLFSNGELLVKVRNESQQILAANYEDMF